MALSEDKLDDLLDRWEEAWRDGRYLSASELCSDQPEYASALRERIAGLINFERFDSKSGTETQHELPKQIGKYEVVEEIARGGMGVVYRCRQQTPSRQVAVKVLRQEKLTGTSLARFEREIDALGMLSHPSIAKIFDAGITDIGHGPQPFLVMEFIDGTPLLEFVEFESLGRRKRIRLIVDVAEAIEHAHQQGIIHRDINPSNILVDADAKAKILDFGIARVEQEHGDDSLTTHRAILGTLPYMSPEQVTGEQPSARSDIYSLGVVLYQLLSGELPLDPRGKSLLQATRSIQEDAPPALGERDSQLRGDLETVVAKAIAKRPDDRYASAGDYSADLIRYLRGDPVTARPLGRSTLALRWALRHPAITSLAATVFALLAAGLATTSYLAIEANAATHREAEAREDERAALELAEERLAHLKREAYSHQLIRAGEVAASDPELAIKWLEDESHCPLDKRCIAWEMLRSSCERERRSIPCNDASCSVNGRWLLTVHRDNEHRVHDVVAGQTISSFRPSEGILRLPMISPNGKFIVASDSENRVVVVHAETGQVVVVLDDHGHQYPPVYDFSPGGDRLVTGGLDGNVRHYSVPDFSLLQTSLTHQQGVRSLRFSHNGKLLASSGVGKQLKLEELESGKTLFSNNRHRIFVQHLTFSPDDTLLVSTAPPESMVWDTKTGELVQLLHSTVDNGSNLVFSNNGTTAASATGNRITLWNARTWTPRLTFRGHKDSVKRIVFSADDQQLVSVGGSGDLKITSLKAPKLFREVGACEKRTTKRIISHNAKFVAMELLAPKSTTQIWSTASGSLTAEINRQLDRSSAIAISHDERFLATSGRFGTLSLWRLDTKENVHEAPLVMRRAESMEFSPDGQHLALGSRDGRFLVYRFSNRTAKPIHQVSPGRVSDVAYSPDGDVVACAWRHGEVRFYDAREQLIGSAETVAVPTAIAFSPDGKTLAIGTNDGQIRFWSLSRKEFTASSIGHSNLVRDVSFSPNGETLVSASDDRSIRLWDSATGLQKLVLIGHAQAVQAARFESSGKAIVSVSTTGKILRWAPPSQNPDLSGDHAH